MNLLMSILSISILGSKFGEGESQMLFGLKFKPRVFNYHVSIHSYDMYLCGGGIINGNHILTAAHCIETFEAHELLIIAGVKYLNHPERVERLVKGKFIPPNFYDSNRKLHDMAVLRLQTPLELGESVGVIPLPTAPQSAENVTICSFVGLERSLLDERAYNLKYTWVKLMLMPNRVCECMMGRLVDSSLLCATIIEENEVTPGDDGGILVCNGVAVGILVEGKNYAYIFTRIYETVTWIRNEIAEP